MILSANGYTATVGQPLWGYTCSYRFGAHFIETSEGYLKVFDDGVEYDSRACNWSQYLSIADKTTFDNFLRGDNTNSRARGDLPITLSLGATPATGFFPAGPDRGDVGDFILQVSNRVSGGMQFDPWKKFTDEITVQIITPPAYTIPVKPYEGNFQIGTVGGLRYPKDAPALTFRDKITGQITRAGAYSVIDLGLNAKSIDVSFTLQMTSESAGKLTEYFISNRFGTFSVYAGSGSYFSGIEGGSGSSFNARLNQPSLDWQHVGHNYWQLPLTLRMG